MTSISRRYGITLLLVAMLSMSFLGSGASWKTNLEAICDASERGNVTAPEGAKITLKGEPVERVQCDQLDAYSYAEMDINRQPPYETNSEYLLALLLLPLIPVLYGYRSGEGLQTLKNALIGFAAPSIGFLSGIALASISGLDGPLLALAGLAASFGYIFSLYRADSSRLQLGTYSLTTLCTVAAWLSIFLVSSTL